MQIRRGGVLLRIFLGKTISIETCRFMRRLF
jgi:hypothetical protein